MSNTRVKAVLESTPNMVAITGDSETVTRAVAEELGLDDFFAEVLPDDKAKRIRELHDQDLKRSPWWATVSMTLWRWLKQMWASRLERVPTWRWKLLMSCW